MQIFALISQKGGAGKSTLARHFACLSGEEGPTWILDRDPQQTCARWHDWRGKGEGAPAQPELLDLGNARLEQAVQQMRHLDGRLFLDTRPQIAEPEAEAARVADLVIVPVQPSPDDLQAVGDTLQMLRQIGKNPLVIVNRARTAARAIAARAALSEHGVRVCPHHISDRTVYSDAALEGRAVQELRGAAAGTAGAEVRQVWDWIKVEATRG